MTLKPTHPQTVLFDWDGTLVDSYGFLNDAHSHVLTELGFAPFRQDEFKQYFGKPREILYRTIYKDWSEEAKTLFEQYVNQNTDKLKFMQDADSVLKLLHDRNVTLGIVSNKKGSIVRREIENFGWESFFTVVVAAGEAASDKPSGAPLLLAMSRTGHTGTQASVWYVGDTEIDMKSAQEAGCPAVLLTHGEEMTNIVKEYNPILALKNCQELHEFLVALSA